MSTYERLKLVQLSFPDPILGWQLVDSFVVKILEWMSVLLVLSSHFNI